MRTKTWFVIVAGIAFMAAAAARLPAQSLFATLTGVVSDPSGAVVAGATVKLVNEASGSERATVTNSSGFYTFIAVSVGSFTYKLTVEKQGFETYQAPGIELLGGQKRNVNVTLKLGATTQTVEVTGVASSIVPVDSGEKSQTLTVKQLSDFVQVGSDAAEYLKIMPGFGVQNGTKNKASYTGEIIGINGNGDSGSQSPLNNAFSYDGLPANSLEITADGAHVADPGCDCDTPVNPNADMISEFKVSTSFSAENQRGPIVISSVTKSGGSQFHGDAMFSARNFALNSNDSLFNENHLAKPQDKFYYPEGQIGGPVIIPGTSFNKSREKLFFFTGFEYYYQTLDTGLLRATVPTAGMLNGDFSPTQLGLLGKITQDGAPASLSSCYTGVAPNFNTIPANCFSTRGTPPVVYPSPLYAQPPAALPTTPLFPGGIIPQMTAGQPGSGYDPNQIALMKLYPMPNADPNSNGGYNYVHDETFNQNDREWKSRVDYNISDNTKLFVRYSYQREVQQFPVQLWWRAVSTLVPYPTPILGKNRSDSITTSLTHVFSPTMTNEFVFGYTFVGFPNVFKDPTKVDRSTVGYNYPGVFNNGVKQIPSFGSIWGGGDAATIFNPGGFEVGGPSTGLFSNKWMPTLQDTVAKVHGTHTIKVGAFWEYIRNDQPDNQDSNGLQQYATWSPQSTGDSYADEALGLLTSYTEQNFNRVLDIAYNEYEGFAQDDWKATKRLTINVGLRVSHFQPWQDRVGDGFSIFNPAQYAGQACTATPTFCGFEWHKKDPNVPIAGFPTRALFYSPRIGAAYDLGGSGKTVLRGAWGRYYYHDGQFTAGLETSAGSATAGLGSVVSLGGLNVPDYAANLSKLGPAALPPSPLAVDSTDDLQAHTDFYNFTISQRMPWSSLLEASYVGNRTRDVPSTANGGSLLGPTSTSTLNVNKIPIGAMLSSNNGGANPNNLPCAGTNCTQLRPFPGYGDLYEATNNAYANYNAVQVTWLRTKGRYDIDMNYTYGRAMGIVGFFDQFNLNNNYGVLPTNRTHIFSAAYHVNLPAPAKNHLAAQVVNGWQLSGLTQLESGADLSNQLGGLGSVGNFNMSIPNGATIPGTPFTISSASILGTPDITLDPLLSCNPGLNNGPHQYINSSCFSAPTVVGQNGPTVTPPIYGPAYFNWDLGLFKSFRISESKSFQFRVDAYNFLNHALWSFPGGNNLDLDIDPTTLTAKTPSGAPVNPNFGVATDRQGQRIIQLQVKFLF